MANNYTQTSFLVKCSKEEAQMLLDIVEKEEERLEEEQECDFGAQIKIDPDGIWITEEEFINVEAVAEALSSWVQRLKWTLPISFTWADTCSKPRLDEFGGGAVVIWPDGRIEWMTTGRWVSQTIAGGDDD